ncbi:GNAT family N-acetyltransferase [Saccharospirillum impatiens]|uniref:GNAT family N-acetyltransferase n=1 Tax=Saccharospirillum impatiens TaxID=169438 RepID=UPI0006842AF3|nr:GNAT family N-acetyltransferase [Saccharospirillum impatiens]
MTEAVGVTGTDFRIQIDDLSGPEIALLLEEHLADMNATSPPESKHALDLGGLKHPDVTFWTLWARTGNGQGDQLAGCCALKRLDDHHGEIKSMRTAPAFRRQGVAQRLLQHLLDEARAQHLQRLSLETGSMDYFAAARALYSRFGFEVCLPFGDYTEDPNSVFMTRLV